MILQMMKDDPECGGVFVFDRESAQWYWLDFERFDRPFTPNLFDRIFREYKLFAFLDRRALFSKNQQPPPVKPTPPRTTPKPKPHPPLQEELPCVCPPAV